MNTPTHMDDLIDSRDVIARIEELTDERESLVNDIEQASAALTDLDDDDTQESRDDALTDLETATAALKDWDADNVQELTALQDLAKQGADYATNWEYGETLIRDSYFKEYAIGLADDIGAINSDASWPMTCIDWDQAAEELQMDYSSIEFNGITYWVR